MYQPTVLPQTLGALRQSSFSEARLGNRSVKDELRSNLICKIQRGENLFPGILGFEDTVVPQIVNAVLSRHNFILLGLRGQAKTRLARMLTTLLDPWMPYIAGCEIKDHLSGFAPPVPIVVEIVHRGTFVAEDREHGGPVDGPSTEIEQPRSRRQIATHGAGNVHNSTTPRVDVSRERKARDQFGVSTL